MRDLERVWGEIIRQVEWYADVEKQSLDEKKKREEERKKEEGKK